MKASKQLNCIYIHFKANNVFTAQLEYMNRRNNKMQTIQLRVQIKTTKIHI